MSQLFNVIEIIFFTKLFGQVTLYSILSTGLKFLFVLIVLAFVSRIVRMITMDLKMTIQTKPSSELPIGAASLRLVGDPEDYSFPVREEYFLSENTTLGRADDNSIVIKDPKLSKHQARIVQNGEIFLIDDLKATNPTTVNGEAVRQPRELHSKDRISVGGIDFLFLIGADYEA